MADVKISGLPNSGALTGPELIAGVQAGTTVKMTPAQLATFMQTAMALIKLSGLNIQLNADGSAQFAGVKILFNADGSCSFASANAAFAADGALNLPLSHFPADGSAQFANGTATIDAGGNAGLTTLQLPGGGFDFIHLFDDGSATFATNSIFLNGDGSIVANNGITSLTEFSVNGLQVVGAQQPAISNATNSVDVITQLNLLLAALRTHGLIDT